MSVLKSESVEWKVRDRRREMDENEKERLYREATVTRTRHHWARFLGLGLFFLSNNQLLLFPSVYTWRWRYRLRPILIMCSLSLHPCSSLTY